MTAVRSVPGDLELQWHLRLSGRTLLYLLLSVPVRRRLPGAAAVRAAARRRLIWSLVELERRQANRLLDAHLAPDPARAAAGRVPPRARDAADQAARGASSRSCSARCRWRARRLLVLGVEGLGGDADRVVGPWALGPASGRAVPARAARRGRDAGRARRHRAAAARDSRSALLRPETTGEGPVRELLAERLGDRSLNIAYWLPDREIFVDERGRRVHLPRAGSGRAWTAVDHEGNRVAAIVHDAELDATPELVHAAASAAALALDNERLKADLRARLEELRDSRRRIVEAGDDARRRIERDLHDGAQQQLVSLALDLRLLRARLKEDPEAAATVEELADKLAAALAELRELARGIHPAVLSDHGLATAIHVLVERAPMPVECDLELEDRLPRADRGGRLLRGRRRA